MLRCIELARQAKHEGNTPVGSVVAFEGQMIGEGREQLPRGLTLTGHAEALACQKAAERMGSRLLRQATLYSTAEPCLMCSYIIRQAEMAKVVYAIQTPFIGGATSEFPVLTDDKLNGWKPAVVAIGNVMAEEVMKLGRN
jgi:tRNA(adenine34) deaminase